MKTPTYLLIYLSALTPCGLFAEDGAPKNETTAGIAAKSNVAQLIQPHLTKFDLDFPGGSPGELITAIQKSMGRPVNVIVPVEYAARKLPPLKMNGVDVPHLFKALLLGSYSSDWLLMPGGTNGNLMQREVQYGFRTVEQDPGVLSDDTIWAFYDTNVRPPSVARFYLLTPYLDGGLTVDDITTAIQTGWRLKGDTVPPKLNFHKETKLLIAVGDQGELETIDSVLNALYPLKAKPVADKSATEAKKGP